MDYYAKYLKYKTKYLELKKKLEGGIERECGTEKYDDNISYCGKKIVEDEKGISHKVKAVLDKLENDSICIHNDSCKSKKCGKKADYSRITTCNQYL
jgi:hypothetical protein